MNIAIVEDDARYRSSLVSVLEHSREVTVQAVFESAADAVRAAADTPDWDLILMDIDTPRMNGIDATRHIKATLPDVHVVMLTVFEEPQTIVEAICAGADGYLLKRSSAKQIIECARTVTNGGAPLTADVARTLLELVRKGNTPSGRRPPRIAELNITPREQDVLRCLVNGCSYKQVADEMGIKIGTVRTYIKALYRKLQVHSVAEAVTRAIRDGLV